MLHGVVNSLRSCSTTAHSIRRDDAKFLMQPDFQESNIRVTDPEADGIFNKGSFDVFLRVKVKVLDIFEGIFYIEI